MPSENVLLRPFQLGSYLLRNRYVNIIWPEKPEPDLQAGLVLTESYNIAYWNEKDVAPIQQTVNRWRTTTFQVHQAGGTIFLPLVYQLPQPIPNSWQRLPSHWPRPAGQQAVINKLRQAATEYYYYAAVLAKEAGFDGIEIVVSAGSLLGEFLCNTLYHSPSTIEQKDQHFQDRFRLLAEVIRSVAQVWHLNQIAIRTLTPADINLMPLNTSAGIATDENADALSQQVVHYLNDYGLAYLRIPEDECSNNEAASATVAALRPYYDGVLISQGNYADESARCMVTQGHADLIIPAAPQARQRPANRHQVPVAN